MFDNYIYFLAFSFSLIASLWLFNRLRNKHHKWIFAIPFLSTVVMILVAARIWVPDLMDISYYSAYYIAERPRSGDFAGAIVRWVFLIIVPAVFIFNSIFTAGLWLCFRCKLKRKNQ